MGVMDPEAQILAEAEALSGATDGTSQALGSFAGSTRLTPSQDFLFLSLVQAASKSHQDHPQWPLLHQVDLPTTYFWFSFPCGLYHFLFHHLATFLPSYPSRSSPLQSGLPFRTFQGLSTSLPDVLIPVLIWAMDILIRITQP